MSVNKRVTKKGVVWDARYRDPNGRPVQRTFRTKRDAERHERQQRDAVEQGVYIDASRSRITFEDWIAECGDALRPPAVKSQHHFEYLVRCHVLPELGTRRLSTIKPLDLEKWLNGLTKVNGSGPLGISGKRQVRSIVKRAFEKAMENDLIVRSPAVGLKLPKAPTRKVKVLPAEDVEALSHAMPPKYQALALVLGYGGLRYGEMAALRRRHFDPLHGRLLIEAGITEVGGHIVEGDTKTGEPREVPLPASVAAALNEHLDAWVDGSPDAVIFTSPRGEWLRYSNFMSKVWRPAVRAARLDADVTPHVLRHTCASLHIQAGASILAVSKWLGHSDPAMTLRVYGHLFPGDLEALAVNLDARRIEALGSAA